MTRRPAPADIEIIATGGNFEKRTASDGSLFYDLGNTSQLEHLLQSADAPNAVINTLFLKDSSSFTDLDRQNICTAVAMSPLPRVIVIHGTSTLAETARAIYQLSLEKTVIISGTSQSVELNLAQSFFNLGAAVSLVQALPPGVYGCMNGRIIHPMSLRKDPETGRFDTASGEHLRYTKSPQ